MTETDLQKFVCDAVTAEGGFAYKMSHRFLVGVVDLFVKLPDMPVMLFEVKQRAATVNTHGPFTFPATHLQKRFLQKARMAGVLCGGISFIQGKNVSALRAAVFPLVDLVLDDWKIRHDQHVALGGPDVRTRNMVRLIRGVQ